MLSSEMLKRRFLSCNFTASSELIERIRHMVYIINKAEYMTAHAMIWLYDYSRVFAFTLVLSIQYSMKLNSYISFGETDAKWYG